MNNPLVPQLRADVNGKLVTRHVRDTANSATASSTLPAPVITPAPQLSDKEMKKVLIEELKVRLYSDKDADPKRENTLSASLSWFTIHMMENLKQALNEGYSYENELSRGNTIRHELEEGRGFPIAMQASVYDIRLKLRAAKFELLMSPKELCTSFFGSATTKYIKDENVKDFRVAYLAMVLGLDEGIHSDGKMAHYRDLALMGEKMDEVMHALPVLKVIVDDNDNSMIDDGVVDILTISSHLSNRSEDDVNRVAQFIANGRDDMYSYDTELVSEMLENTTPAMTTGWL